MYSLFTLTPPVDHSKYNFSTSEKNQALSHLLCLHSPVCVGLVGNLEDRFSYNEAQIASILYII